VEELLPLLADTYDAVVLSAHTAVRAQYPRIIVGDVGFFSELQLLVDTFGGAALLLVHVVRDGCAFYGDPRSYIDHPAVDAVTISYDRGWFNFSFLAYLFFELQVHQ